MAGNHLQHSESRIPHWGHQKGWLEVEGLQNYKKPRRNREHVQWFLQRLPSCFSKSNFSSTQSITITLFPPGQPKYIQRLKAIRATLEHSSFFKNHEIIGSSLLFLHDRRNASCWLIDFAKTEEVAEGQITHFKDWEVGNHEDGYLIGLNNIIEIFSAILKDAEKSHDNNLSDSSEWNLNKTRTLRRKEKKIFVSLFSSCRTESPGHAGNCQPKQFIIYLFISFVHFFPVINLEIIKQNIWSR